MNRKKNKYRRKNVYYWLFSSIFALLLFTYSQLIG